MNTAPTASKILIVDDEDDIRANVQDILSDLGYDCDVASNGNEALKLVRETQYDVALLDFKMPGMDGLTLYREIKKLQPAIVAILVTAFADGTTPDEVREAGAWKLVRKPVEMSELLLLIEDALAQPIILVIDDDSDFCESLWEVLREKGFRVCTLCNEDEALHRIRQPNFQVALIDLKLGQGDGAHVFHELRNEHPEARTILVTGFHSEMNDMITQLCKNGADAVCYKPLDVSKLLSTIDSLV